MAYTPVELRHVRVKRGLFGFDKNETQKLLDDVADSFENVWRERAELADKVEELEKELTDLRSREQLLSQTLVAAEKAAGDAKERAKREADLIVNEAHQEARSITRAALRERERLFADARRVESVLRAALGVVEEANVSADPEAEPVPEQPKKTESWPRREDTREFGRASLFVPTQPKDEPAEAEPEEPREESGTWRKAAGHDFNWGD